MGAMQELSVSKAVAEEVRAKVGSGAYRSEAEVIREALRALADEEDRVERWLKTVVTASFDALQSDPNNVLTIQQVRDHLASQRILREA